MPAPVGHATSPTWRTCRAITGRAFVQTSETPILVKAITGPAPTALTPGGAASRKTGEGSRSSLIGASVLSGAGSLPLHLMPLIVPVLVIGGRMSLSDAGLVGTAGLLRPVA